MFMVDFVDRLNFSNISFRTENGQYDLLGSCFDFCLMNVDW